MLCLKIVKGPLRKSFVWWKVWDRIVDSLVLKSRPWMGWGLPGFLCKSMTQSWSADPVLKLFIDLLWSWRFKGSFMLSSATCHYWPVPHSPAHSSSSVLDQAFILLASETGQKMLCSLCLFYRHLPFSGILYCLRGFFSLGSMTHGGDLQEPGQQGLYREFQAFIVRSWGGEGWGGDRKEGERREGKVRLG